MNLHRLAVAAAALIAAHGALAQTWTGNTSNLFNEGSNWSPSGVPSSGASTTLTFSGSSPNLSPNNNLSSFEVGTIQFSGTSSYNLVGNGVTLATRIQVTGTDAAAQTIGLSTITLNASGIEFSADNNSSVTTELTVSSQINLNNHNLATGGAGQILLSGVISGSGSGSTFTRLSGGTTILTGNNTYDGGTSVLGGTLQIGDGGTTGTLGAGALSISGGATAVINRSNDYTIANPLSGFGNLNQVGSGRTILTGSNTSYEGITTVQNGTLQAANSNALGMGTFAETIVNSGATLEVTGGISIDIGKVEISGSGVSSGGALRNVSGNNTISNNLTVNNSASVVSDANTLTLNNVSFTSGSSTSAVLTLGGGGNINAVGNLSLGTRTLEINGGAGTVTLTGTNTYGNTVIEQGTLQLGNGGTTGTLGSGTVTNNSALVVNLSANRTINAMTGSGTLVKQNTGTLTLTGASTYSGTTTVTSGTLVVGTSGSDTLTNAGGLVVQADGTLGGVGSIGGETDIYGTHAPGSSAGIQSFSNLNYSGATVEWELFGNTNSAGDRGTQYDGINVSGNLTTSTSSINLVFNASGSSVLWSNSFWNTNRTWLFYDVAGSTTGAFALGSITNDSGNNALSAIRSAASFSFTQSGSDLLVLYTVPEPTTLTLLAAALAFLAYRSRRNFC